MRDYDGLVPDLDPDLIHLPALFRDLLRDEVDVTDPGKC